MKDNFGLKVFALLVALLIWLQSVLVSEHRSKVNLPVNMRNLPANITLENLPHNVPFNVAGKGYDIIRLALSKPVVNIDASGISEGADLLTLNKLSFDTPENINVTILGPSDSRDYSIQADVFHQKVVRIQPEFKDIETRQQVESSHYSLNPERVTIYGPKSRVQDIEYIHTAKIDEEALKAAQSEISLISPHKDVNISAKTVLFTMRGSQESTKVFSDINLPANYFPTKVAVKVQAAANLLNQLSAGQIKATVSNEMDSEGFYQVEIKLPAGYQILAITPDKVRKRR